MNINQFDDVINRGKSLIVFGAGNWGLRLITERVIRVECFIDNSPLKQGTHVGNIPVYAPDYLQSINPDETIIIIANEHHSDEMKQELLQTWSGDVVVYEPQQEGYFDKLRYNVTYRCNSRCQTCNIWKNDGGYEMSPDEFGELLNSPAFSEIENFYITGGEPTLRKDFPKFVEVAIKKLPKLKWISTVTSAILVDRTVDIMDECHKLCYRNDIGFRAAVSIDGTKEIHDKTRGVPRGFEKAVTAIDRMKAIGINVAASTTISSFNVWCLEELRAFLHVKEWVTFYKYAQFEEFFNFKELSRSPFNYDNNQKYQVLLFFHKILEIEEKLNFSWNTAYNTIATIEGRKRLLICGYHDTYKLMQCGFLMQGGFLMQCYASAFSTDQLNPDTVKSEHRSMRQSTEFFLHTKCEDCLSDTFSYPSEEMLNEIKQRDYWQSFLSPDGFEKYKDDFIPYSSNLDRHVGHNALIVGNWGREDVVSGTWLKSYIQQRISEENDLIMTICSEYPFITKRTLNGIANVEVVPIYERDFLSRVRLSDELIIFGNEYDGWTLWAEKIAKENGITIQYVIDEQQAIHKLCALRMDETLNEICCCIDADKESSAMAIKQALDLSNATGMICHYYSINNFCLGKFGDNRDTYFEIILNIVGENWKEKCWIDSELADFSKLSEAMTKSKIVIAVGDKPKLLSEALGITPYEIEVNTYE